MTDGVTLIAILLVPFLTCLFVVTINISDIQAELKRIGVDLERIADSLENKKP